MISEKELLKAIEETERLPVSFQNCEKLATFYILLDHLHSAERMLLKRKSDSEFISVIADKNLDEVMPVLDELMQTLDVVNNKLYTTTINTLRDL